MDPSVSFYGAEVASGSTNAAGQTQRTASANHLLSFIILPGILCQSPSVCFYFGGLVEGESSGPR